jgi:hypothetical protein
MKLSYLIYHKLKRRSIVPIHVYGGVYCVSLLSKLPGYIDNIADIIGKKVTRKDVYANNASKKRPSFLYSKTSVYFFNLFGYNSM